MKIFEAAETRIWLMACLLFAIPTSLLAADYPDELQCREQIARGAISGNELQGWCLFIDRRRGNCIACHGVDIHPWPDHLAHPGNAGPVLSDLNTKFSSAAKLEAFVHDPSASNPDTFMPAYGKHKILEQQEIKMIVQFLLNYQK